MSLAALFPYFGGKRRHVVKIWEALGDPQAYVEPFCGSAAVLLGRPKSDRPRRRELINDLNCWVTNFWQAVTHDPDGVADAARSPVNELLLASRQQAFTAEAEDRLRSDPRWYDVELAGWWAWGMACSISGKYPNSQPGSPPFCRNYQGATQPVALAEWCRRLAGRLERVQVVCGGWERALSPSLHMDHSHSVGVFLDPPYELGDRDGRIYHARSADYVGPGAVAEWARAAGVDEQYRIVLCGFEGEHEMPGWEYVPLGKVGKTKMAPEGMWLSPGCVRPSAGRLFL